MGMGTFVGVLFFILVLFAALTSSIALTESSVSTIEDELGWSRKKSTLLVAVVMVILGTLSCLGYGPLASVTIIGMQFLDFFDFIDVYKRQIYSGLTYILMVGGIRVYLKLCAGEKAKLHHHTDQRTDPAKTYGIVLKSPEQIFDPRLFSCTQF